MNNYFYISEPELPNNPLKLAVIDIKSVQMVEFLIENGLFADALWQGVCRTFGGQRFEIRGLTSLSCALARNDRKMVKKLVQLGANVNMKIPCYRLIPMMAMKLKSSQNKKDQNIFQVYHFRCFFLSCQLQKKTPKTVHLKNF